MVWPDGGERDPVAAVVVAGLAFRVGMPLGDPLSGRDLAAFVTAVETGTVQGAADALTLTQSAATKRLLALERRVGRPLLERTAQGVRVTEAGAVLYPLAREALAALVSAEVVVTSPSRDEPLVIHASRTVGETLLPQWLASFRLSGPALRVSVAITNSDEVVRAVRERTADLGFIEGLARSMHGLTELAVAHDELRVVVASGHPWARVARYRPGISHLSHTWPGRPGRERARWQPRLSLPGESSSVRRLSYRALRASSAPSSAEGSPCSPRARSHQRSRAGRSGRSRYRASSFAARYARSVAPAPRFRDRPARSGHGWSGRSPRLPNNATLSGPFHFGMG